MYNCVAFFLLFQVASGVIYKLNDTEYEKMPPLFELDEYAPCLSDPGGVYCIVNIELFSRNNSTLLRMIQDYSAHRIKHFNHTKIHRGICVRRACKGYQNDTNDLISTIQVCTNHSLWEEYKIEGRVNNIQYCKSRESLKLDISDGIVAMVYVILIVLNVAGSIYDSIACKGSEKGNPYLLAFSLKRNWAKLVAPSGKGDDPRFNSIKLFHGMRSITMALVIFAHTTLAVACSFTKNPQFFERSYEDILSHLLYNGSLVSYTFLVISAFLLAYNFQIYREKHSVTWVQLPKGLLLRWLRLTPTYALILATVATLTRHVGDGPLWEIAVTSEANACRTYWWSHLLYINNYVYDNVFCLPQTWYLAVDMQLFCIGMLVCVAARESKTRKVTLGVLFIVSLIIPALHTYLQDLDATLIHSPENYISYYVHYDTLRLVFIRGHTNLSTYTMGLAGGFLIYYWQKEGRTFDKIKKYRWAVWLAFPTSMLIILTGAVFYIDGVTPHPVLKMLYAASYKPIYQFCIMVIIWSCVFKIESVYRGILEWRGFTWTGRVSYSALFTHSLFQRALLGIQVTPIHITVYSMMCFLCASLFLSFVSGAVLWLCVEAPAAALVRAVLAPKVNKNEEGESNTKV